jgi:hypothetical protein
MADSDLLREALEALKDASLNTPDLQHRIAARLAAIYAGGAPHSAVADAPESPGEDAPLDATIPIIPGR